MILPNARSIVKNSSTLVLGGTAVLSALIYWLAFVRPYSLLKLHRQPLLDMRDLSSDDPLAHWRLLGIFMILGVLYWLGWRAARRARGRAAWFTVLAGALLFCIILLFLYPFDAADIFDYIMLGRIQSVYGANPFQQVPSDFKTDRFYAYTAWRNASSAYGPGWEILAGGTAWVAGDGIISNVLAFKLLGGAFLMASVGVAAAILRQVAAERALAGVLLLAWNPIVLYETLGHGHNDIVMVFWMLLAVWTLLQQRYTLTVLALVIGALTKMIPVLLLPAAVGVALHRLPNARARLRFLLVSACAATALIVLAFAPYWHGIETLDIERRQELFTTSLPAVVYALIQPRPADKHVAAMISQAAAALTALFAFGQGIWAWRNSTWLGFTRAAFNTLMFYLLVTCPWFQSWYAVWPLGLAVLLPPGHAARLGVFFGYAVLAKPLVFGPLWLGVDPLPSKFWRELRLGPAVLAMPWLYTLLAIWHNHRSHRAPPGQVKKDIGLVTSDPR